MEAPRLDIGTLLDAADYARAGRVAIAADVLREKCATANEARSALAMLADLPGVDTESTAGIELRLSKEFGPLPSRGVQASTSGSGRAQLPGRWQGIETFGYICPVENLRSIEHLGILSFNLAARVKHRSVADDAVQDRREGKIIHGRQLHDYVNLYVNPRNAMLYRVIKDRRVDDVAVVNVWAGEALAFPGVVLTDRNAAISRCKTFKGRGAISRLDPSEIFVDSWERDRDAEQRMMAEVLIPRWIPPYRLAGVTVVHSIVAGRIRKMGLRLPVHTDEWMFFGHG